MRDDSTPVRRSAVLLLAVAIGLAFRTPAIAALCDGISQVSATPLTTVLFASGFNLPLLVTAPPGDVDRVFVVEQTGRIRIVSGGLVLPTPFLDVSGITLSPGNGGGNEQGLLGLAFDPAYSTNGRFFIYHTDSTGANNVVEAYTRSAANPNVADPATRQVVISFAHPGAANHNGGMIAFSPADGDLYIGTGDGGGGCDPTGNAQNGGSNLGKLLRIDVRTLPYSTPSNNPFVGPDGVNDEIWARGLRNPWRWSFDRLNSDLYIGDVGEATWEEIDWRPASSAGGENYGWDIYEGTSCPNASCGSQGSCSIAGYVGPVTWYDHASTGGCAITGGYVYRGCRMPGLAGTYFFADYCAGFIESMTMVGGVATNIRDRTADLAPGGGVAIDLVTSFGEDGRGEIFVVDRDGEIFKIVPALPNLEVSGVQAAPFLLSRAAFSWEDLEATSSRPIAQYRVYRASDRGTGTFACVHTGPSTVWTGGDPASPASGGIFAYLVTALDAASEESSPGTRTDGTPRTLSQAACP
ncbi:MAG: PQQ-dependent sugar dehydrogenase [Acidobacteriia bacterium]|nr:PQQ-dependent sugar dehydrogenase [Terriglobia bacterium]